ncbi:MAG: trypsin-like peptidase domain-containing protein [Cyanobacteria bacterium P01_D01_bin.6]
MSFSREDYEHAIARIFFVSDEGKKSVIGTGFLVAPGYVLTCAHVVLQALGKVEDEFADYQTAPEGTITLDFLPNEYHIAATVVPTAWRPYGVNQGDIAALQLHAEPPERAKPIPLQRCTCQEIQDETHSVYGFANENGDRSDAYKPKANAVGGRFQFHKEGDPQDDTIDAGFSGAPVWNQARECVVGMVATASVPTTVADRRCKAYAIPEEQLRPVLNDLFARSLCDLIDQGLAESRGPVRNAVDLAFALCEEGRVERETLLGRLQYLTELPNRGWQDGETDVDQLIQFAVFLAVMDGLPDSLYAGLEAWVKFRGFDFDALYKRANRYRQERQVASDYAPGHVIVHIVSVEQSDVPSARVSIWVIGDRNHYSPLEPPKPSLKDEILSFEELPSFLEEWLDEETADPEHLMVHCFVARRDLGRNLDSCDTVGGYTLGSQYKVVMQTDLSQAPLVKKYEKYRERWKTKWQALEHKKCSSIEDIAVRYDCDAMAPLSKEQRSAEIAILENLSAERIDEVFKSIEKKAGWPVILWARQRELCQDLDRLIVCPLQDLPDSVCTERDGALRNGNRESSLGFHLGLIWEDLKVAPPTMMEQLDQSEV